MINYDARLPSCAITFDGHSLDHEVNGYSTLNVEGRGLFSPILDITSIPGRDGDIALGQNFSGRDIKVHFILEACRNEEFLRRTKKLLHILHTDEDVEFYFLDEPNYVRFGRLSEVDDLPYDQNTGIGTFTLHCESPYAFTRIKTATNSIPMFQFTKYPVKLESIRFTVSSSTKRLILKNITRGTKIILNNSDGTFASGDKVVITKEKITVNNQDRTKYLDYVESDYQHFDLYAADKLNLNPSSDIEIKYRERVI